MPDTYRVIVLPEAFNDIERITDYIEARSPQNAAETLERLWAATQSLGELPHRYKVHHSSRDPSRLVRSMPERPFVIYYR